MKTRYLKKWHNSKKNVIGGSHEQNKPVATTALCDITTDLSANLNAVTQHN